MIQEGYQKNPVPAWIYLALVAIAASLLWGGGSWAIQKQRAIKESSSFLQVTNREFSLFLWQFPEYMRANVSSKSGYLPGFQYMNSVAMESGREEEFVAAPPNVLFLYHTWKRLLSNEFAKRPISVIEFREFLEYCPEWNPSSWKAAPKEYITAVSALSEKSGDAISLQDIPDAVQQAFIGWKNFFLEGDLINQLKPTNQEMAAFLKKFPHYARNDWRNIVMKSKPDYLKTLFLGKYDPKAILSESEMTAFLKVAFFNDQQALKSR